MAERLPGGAVRNSTKLPSLASFSTSSVSSYFSVAFNDQMSTVVSSTHESDSNGGSNGFVANGPSSNGHQRNRVGGHSEVPMDGTKLTNTDSNHESEWVEQNEPGVYITLTSLPGGVDLKRVRFSRKRFSLKQAEQWWAENRARVHEQYNVRMVDSRSTAN